MIFSAISACIVFFNHCSYINYSTHVMYLSSTIYIDNFTAPTYFYLFIFYFLGESNKSLYMVSNEYLISSIVIYNNL